MFSTCCPCFKPKDKSVRNEHGLLATPATGAAKVNKVDTNAAANPFVPLPASGAESTEPNVFATRSSEAMYHELGS